MSAEKKKYTPCWSAGRDVSSSRFDFTCEDGGVKVKSGEVGSHLDVMAPALVSFLSFGVMMLCSMIGRFGISEPGNDY